MKKQIRTLLTLMFLCLSFTACDKDDDDDAPDSIYLYNLATKVDGNEGTISVTLFATCAWDVTPNDGWITTDVSHGSEKGIYAVHLSYTANTTGAERVGTVTFKAGTYSELYTITQTAQ